MSLTVGPGSRGKTALEMVEAIAFTIGRDLLHDYLMTTGKSMVTWYLGLEDPLIEYERRVAAILKFYNIPQDTLRGGFFLDSGREQNFVIAAETKHGFKIVIPRIESIIETSDATT